MIFDKFNPFLRIPSSTKNINLDFNADLIIHSIRYSFVRNPSCLLNLRFLIYKIWINRVFINKDLIYNNKIRFGFQGKSIYNSIPVWNLALL